MGYTLNLHRVGASVTNPQGKSVYFQPGDATDAIIETFEALEEIPAGKRDVVADMVLSDYFETE